MSVKGSIWGAGVLLAATTAALAITAARRDDGIQRVDYGVVRTALAPAYDATAPVPSAARIKEFRIPMTHETIEIADGKTYEGWTFGGTVPGPVLRVRQGDTVRITLVNESPMGHSIDLHSARIPMNEAFRTIGPDEELTFEFEARDAGVFMVHCGTPPVLLHIMQGMYLAIIVDPEDGWGTEADKEFVLVQSEFYPTEADPTDPAAGHAAEDSPAGPDFEAARDRDASYVVFNGKAFQYKDHPLTAELGDRVRFFVVNAGPNFSSDFHVVGAVFDRVYPDGNPTHALAGVQTYGVPAGGGAVFEAVFEEGASGEGVYAFVTHAFADADKGAVGLLQVGETVLAAGMGH
ncbi:MAG TPA: multicopper oxidase domain-containing protein [Gemmatimonadota bacterium]|nr:multicopper oxidase domain-containing protein [Gemmatimonadota bacterium]